MVNKPNLTLVPSPPNEEAWTARAEEEYEQGLISADGARRMSGLPIAQHPESTPKTVSDILPATFGKEAVRRTSSVKLVDDNHESAPGARREARLKKPQKARTRQEKLAADQPPERQRVTPHGHDPHVTVHQGGKG